MYRNSSPYLSSYGRGWKYSRRHVFDPERLHDLWWRQPTNMTKYYTTLAGIIVGAWVHVPAAIKFLVLFMFMELVSFVIANWGYLSSTLMLNTLKRKTMIIL